jgi:TonB-linked SusC/RagA family outer membrane protein
MGVSDVLAYPKAMSGSEFADLKLEAYKTQNPLDTDPTYLEALGTDDYNNYNNGTQTNYTKEVLHKGFQREVQFGVSAGTEKLKTYFSLAYYNEKGLLKNDNLNRYTGRLNLDYQIKKFLKVGTQTQITYYDQSKRANPLGNASKINPLTTPFTADGSIIILPGGKHANPLLDEQPNTAVDKLNTIRVFPTIYAELTLLKGLTARTNLAINWDNRSEGIFYAENSYTRLNDGYTTSMASHDASYRTQFNWQGIINYNTTIKEDHTIGITALTEVIKNKTERFYIQATDQLIPEQLYYNLADNTSSITNSVYSKSALVSFAGRINYSFKSKYLLTFTGRSDGASVLADGHKWDFFPSIAGAWRLSDESFMKFQNAFNTIKLRGSWGIAGNANIDPYSTQSTLSRVPYSYDQTGANGYTLKPQIGNKETRWEKSTTWDFGLDLGILKDRITVTFDYYDTKTKDLLLTKKLPLSTGVVQTVANVGKTRNKGIELAVNSVNYQTKNFKWSSTLTFMRNKEEVLALTDGLTNMQVTITDATTNSQNTKTVVVGSPVNSYYDYEKVGIWQLGEDDQAAGFGQQPGKIHIKDQNGDGQITPADRVVVGSSVPKWSGGFNSEFKLYNFDLSFFLYARVGQTINYQYAYSPNGTENSLSTREYWTPENPTNDLPRPGLVVESQYLGTLRYTNGSFLKLRNATIGYTLPSSVSKKFMLSKLRIYVTGKNLLVKSKIKDYDPEMQGSLTFPTVRLFVAGLNMEF